MILQLVTLDMTLDMTLINGRLYLFTKYDLILNLKYFNDNMICYNGKIIILSTDENFMLNNLC
jgi:hypothetical protein